jgi:ABC-2 type transport system ATP-binding protein
MTGHLQTGSASPQEAIRVEDLVKTYPSGDGGKVRALDGITFEVKRGEIVGILGPNGAGKTTTLEILEGLRKPDSGTALVLGFDVVAEPKKVKAKIGVQLQQSSYFEELSLVEILRLLGSYYARSLEPHSLLEQVGLLDKAKARFGQLSGGQRQKFSLAAALVNDPELVFLDEPTTGLDPRARREVWELITELRKDATRTLVITTHYMEEAERLADRVAIIDRGRIVAYDTPASLIGSVGGSYRASMVVRGLDRTRLIEIAGRIEEIAGRTEAGSSNVSIRPIPDGRGERLELACRSPKEVASILDRIDAEGGSVEELLVRGTTLEDVFLSLTGRQLDDRVD